MVGRRDPTLHKRVLFWTPNYAPEYMGIPPLVTDAAKWMAARGHEVTVVTALPNYPTRRIFPGYRGRVWMSEEREGVTVMRSWLRARPNESFVDKVLYEASFAALSAPRLLTRMRSTDVLVCVVPSLAAALAAATARRMLGRAAPRLVLWVQDLVLMAGALVGTNRAARATLTAAKRWEAAAVSAADRTIVCSPGFTNYLRQIGADISRTTTLLNWVDVDEYQASPAPPGSRTLFIYAGNIGYTQGLEVLVDAAALLPQDVAVEIVGDGNAFRQIADRAAGIQNVAVKPSVPRQEAPRLLSRATAHIVIQRSSSAGANLPSKIATCLATGRPIIASFPYDTPAAEILAESGAAILVPPDDPVALSEALIRIHENRALQHRMGLAGRAFASCKLDKRGRLERLEQSIVEAAGACRS